MVVVTIPGGATGMTHSLYVGWSTDTTVLAAEVLLGTSSDTDTVITLPKLVASIYGSGGLILTVVTLPRCISLAVGNQRNVFGAAAALTVSTVAGQLIITANLFNADLTSGESLRVV